MVVCPICNLENRPGTLFCTKCYSLLIDGQHNLATTPLTQDLSRTANEPRQGNLRVITSKWLALGDVALYINGSDRPFVVQISHEAILGRCAPDGQQLRVDLSPFQAFEKGVSRSHAVLRRAGEGLLLEDLNSGNGTWLNDQRLEPYKPTPLQSGDRINLCKLDLEIYLPAPAHFPAQPAKQRSQIAVLPVQTA